MQMMALTEYVGLWQILRLGHDYCRGVASRRPAGKEDGILNHRTTSVMFSTALILLPGK